MAKTTAPRTSPWFGVCVSPSIDRGLVLYLGNRPHLNSRRCGDLEHSGLPLADVGHGRVAVRLSVRPGCRAKVVTNYAAAFRRLLALQDHAGNGVGRRRTENQMDSG